MPCSRCPHLGSHGMCSQMHLFACTGMLVVSSRRNATTMEVCDELLCADTTDDNHCVLHRRVSSERTLFLSNLNETNVFSVYNFDETKVSAVRRCDTLRSFLHSLRAMATKITPEMVIFTASSQPERPPVTFLLKGSAQPGSIGIFHNILKRLVFSWVSLTSLQFVPRIQPFTVERSVPVFVCKSISHSARSWLTVSHIFITLPWAGFRCGSRLLFTVDKTPGNYTSLWLFRAETFSQFVKGQTQLQHVGKRQSNSEYNFLFTCVGRQIRRRLKFQSGVGIL